MKIKKIIRSVTERKKLSVDEIAEVILFALKGSISPAQISGVFTAMTIEGINKDFYLASKTALDPMLGYDSCDINIFSNTQSDFVFLLIFYLSEFSQKLSIHFKDLKEDNSDVFKKMKSEEIYHYSDGKASISLNNYNYLLRNIAFLDRELGFSHILHLLEIIASGQESKLDVLILDKDLYSLECVDVAKIFEGRVVIFLSSEVLEVKRVIDYDLNDRVSIPIKRNFDVQDDVIFRPIEELRAAIFSKSTLSISSDFDFEKIQKNTMQRFLSFKNQIFQNDPEG